MDAGNRGAAVVGRSKEVQALIDSGMSQLRTIAHSIYVGLPRGTIFDEDDLFHVGYFGLVEAAESYDKSIGTAFATHAFRRIRGSILDHIRECDFAPRLVRWRTRLREQFEEDRLKRTGRKPTDAEVDRYMRTKGRAKSGVNIRNEADWRPVWVHSYDVPVAPGSEETKGEFIPLPDDPPDDTADLVRELKRGFGRREQLIISGCLAGLRLHEIGKAIGISESRTSQLWSELRPIVQKRYERMEAATR